MVNPYEIDVSLSQIGGCERIKKDLVNTKDIVSEWEFPKSCKRVGHGFHARVAGELRCMQDSAVPDASSCGCGEVAE